jgi:hypothetical protein
LLVRRWYGRKEMTGYFAIKKKLQFWMFNFSPSDGLKLNLLSLIITFILGAKPHSFVRGLVNLFYFCSTFAVIFGCLLWCTLCREDSPLFILIYHYDFFKKKTWRIFIAMHKITVGINICYPCIKFHLKIWDRYL